jgi:hypothetical protein
MAKPVIKGMPFLWGGHRLSKHTMTATLQFGAEEVDSTCWEDLSMRAVAGLFTREISIEGAFAGDFEHALLMSAAGQGGTIHPLLLPLAPSAAFGTAAVAQDAWLSGATPGGARGELQGFAQTYSADQDLLTGKIFLNSLTTPTAATATSTGIQLGALTAGNLAWLCVQASDLPGITGTSPELVVTLESDVDNTFGTPIVRLTATTIEDLAAGYLMRLDGDTTPVTDTWWRVVATLAGTDPTYPLLIGAGICAG